ncbi:MAG: hypothetical protein II685_02720, partial [Clostridia bacterium]|nr:hypothetical protein [Clostridia bacterium]
MVSVGTKLAVRNEDEENEKQISNIQYNLKADGEFVEFGSYHIAVNNTKMPLRWKILTIEEDKALIITFMGIDVLNFNDEQGSSTWENSYIRKWLNDDFYNEAFSASEKQLIVEANLMNYKNVDYRVENGGKTKDNVFLLSIDEVQRFFRSDEQRIVKPTAYAKSKGVFVAPNGNCWWWLRSSGNSESYAADVDYGGDVDTYGSDRFFGRNCVRPAVWISLAFLNENKRMTFKESFYNSHSKSFESPVNTNKIPDLAVSEAANTQPPIPANPQSPIPTDTKKDNGSAKKDNGSKIPLFNPKNIFKSNAPAKATGKKKILFGNYYHDDSVNAIPIQWEVLAVEKKQALIITSYGIESMRYSFSNVDCNWEKSSVRQWLNNDFLSFAFSEKEKKLIKPVTISTPDNPYYKTRGCSSTTDYIFLLSLNEVAAYLPTMEERMTVGSPYAQGNGAFAAPNGCSW